MPFRLADFDREALVEYGITQREIEYARRYVVLLQGTDSKTYTDIATLTTTACLSRSFRSRSLSQRQKKSEELTGCSPD